MDKEFERLLASPPKQFRPIPFWSWNARLCEEETTQQLAQMDEAGIGGVFMHARGGLQTGYMGHEWMDNIRAAVTECKRRGMSAWGYDENGWPSGFGGGFVNRMGAKYQQKYLRCSHTPPRENAVSITSLPVQGQLFYFYYEINQNYVDLLDPKVTRAFLRSVHQQYKRRLGEQMGGLAGFFTDEPQLSRSGYPWSQTLPTAYRKRYGEPLLERLPDLFFPTDTASRTRVRYWRLVTDLFAEHYAKQVSSWCHENGVKLTGHLVCEETLGSQLTSNGACMPHYEYFDIPGIDWLGRGVSDCLTPLQASSVAHQLGRQQILSESFAMCGWNVSFEELRWIFEWQMVRGITLLCQHLEPYSLAGIRKRDYPAALFIQQPWWKEYSRFNDFVSRIGMLLTLGSVHFDVLLLHPQQSAWLLYDGSEEGKAKIDALNASLLSVIKALEDAQIPFHLGDDRILAQHAQVEGKRLCVGTQRYRAVIVPPCRSLDARVLSLLTQFSQNGGTLLWVKQEIHAAPAHEAGLPSMVDGAPCTDPYRLAAASICVPLLHVAQAIPSCCKPLSLSLGDGSPAAGIAATMRDFDQEGFRMYYLVNTDSPACTLIVRTKGADAVIFDPTSGKKKPLSFVREDGELRFSLNMEQRDSAVIFVFEKSQGFFMGRKKKKMTAHPRSIAPSLSPTWEIVHSDPNALTLDRCDCFFHGKPAGENLPAIEITELACALAQPVELRLAYRFHIAQPLSGPLYLVCESPKNYRFTINGKIARLSPCGYYRDKSFVKLNISKFVKAGRNELCMDTCFQQYGSVYSDFRAAAEGFESVRNRLTYDEEVEAIYLVGNFRVDTPGVFQAGQREDRLYQGDFSLTPPSPYVCSGDLVRQGFPFFSGQMTLRNTFQLTQEECQGRCLRFAKRGAIVLNIRVNGRPAGKIFWRPYEINLDGLLHEGENKIEITLTGSLRNLLGPHHLKEGECYSVSPGSFYRRSQVWRDGDNPDWTDGYSFVEFGLFLK